MSRPYNSQGPQGTRLQGYQPGYTTTRTTFLHELSNSQFAERRKESSAPITICSSTSVMWLHRTWISISKMPPCNLGEDIQLCPIVEAYLVWSVLYDCSTCYRCSPRVPIMTLVPRRRHFWYSQFSQWKTSSPDEWIHHTDNVILCIRAQKHSPTGLQRHISTSST